MTPTRDSANLLVIGRIAQGSMQAYDSKGQRFIPFLRRPGRFEFRDFS